MTELDVTWGRAARVYWSFVWRTILFMIPFGLVISLIVMFLASIHILPEAHRWMIQIVGMPFGVLLGIYITKRVLSASMSDFRIALVAVPKGGGAQQIASADGPTGGGLAA